MVYFSGVNLLAEHTSVKISESELEAARVGNEGALTAIVSALAPKVHALAEKLCCDAAESDDLFQEGMLGVLSAVKSYNAARGASFATYATVCARNCMLSVLRRVSSGKSVPAAASVSLEDSEIASDMLDLAEQMILKEEYSRLSSLIQDELSEKEKSVLKLYLGGSSYKETALLLGISEKSVDNALQRIRRKLKS